MTKRILVPTAKNSLTSDTENLEDHVRFTPGCSPEMATEHTHRYLLAADYCEGKRVLDVACGEGYGSYILAQSATSVVGMDIDEKTISAANKRYGSPIIDFVAASCTQIPFPDGSFDVVVSFETIEHISEQKLFLSEISRVLRPNGIAIISTPEVKEYNRHLEKPNPFHTNELSTDDFATLLSMSFQSVFLIGQKAMFCSITTPLARISHAFPSQAEQESVKYESAQFLSGDSVLKHSEVDKDEQTRSLPAIGSRSRKKLEKCGPARANDQLSSCAPVYYLQDNIGTVTREEGVITPIYLIAICTNGELRLKHPHSLYHDGSSPYIVSALQGGIREREVEIIENRKLLIAAKEKLANLEGKNQKLHAALSGASTLSDALHIENEDLLATNLEISSNLDKCRLEYDEVKHKLAVMENCSRHQYGRAEYFAVQLEQLEARQKIQDSLQSTLLQAIMKMKVSLMQVESSRSHRILRTLGLQNSIPLLEDEMYSSAKTAAPSYREPALPTKIKWLLTGRYRNRCHNYRLVSAIRHSGLFSESYYVRFNKLDNLKGQSLNFLIEHFIAEGAQQNCKPHPLFDTAYYKTNAPDVIAAKINPLYHYLIAGASENRRPNCIFMPDWYSRRNVEVSALDLNPLVHYLTQGFKSGVNPHPLFDARFYLDQYGSSFGEYSEPLGHYLDTGIKDKLWPHPLFDPRFYSSQLTHGLENYHSLIDHYLKFGAFNGYNPNPLFDSEYYLKNNPKLRKKHSNPVVDYQLNWYDPRIENWNHDKRNPHPLFLNTYYSHENRQANKRKLSPLAFYFSQKPSERGPINPFLLSTISIHVNQNLERTRLKNKLEEEAHSIGFRSLTKPDVSIVIPVHNNIALTLRCLKSLTTNQAGDNPSFEVIVVDDLSTDETPSLLCLVSNLQLIRNETNLGFLQSCNKGASFARGKYLVLLNNDTVVFPNWLKQLKAPFESLSDVGLVGSQLLYPSGRLQEAGGIVWPDGSAWNWGRNQIADDYRFNYLRDVDYCSAAAVMVPLPLWEDIGGFDTTYSPAYYEDVDLAFEIQKRKKRVLYQPTAKVIHFEGMSCGKSTESGIKQYQILNRAKFKSKWTQHLEKLSDRYASNLSYINRQARGRLLILDSHLPSPDKDAGSLVQWHYLKIFIELGYQVTFLPQNLRTAEPYLSQMQEMGIEVVHMPFTISLNQYVQQAGPSFDLIMVYRYPVISAHLEEIRRFAPQAKIVFNTVDLHFLRMEREAELAKSSSLAERAASLRKDELKMINSVDKTILLSPAEKELVDHCVKPDSTCVIPLVAEIVGPGTPYAKRRDIAFLGGFGHPPNIDAVIFLTQEIWPIVRKNLPGVQLLIVGSKVTPEIEECAASDILIKGYVEDLGEVFDHVRMSVAPLRFGAGQKGKVLTSMSYGVPAVISNIAAEGLLVEDEKQVLIADSAEDCAEAITRLYNDEMLWNRLSANSLIHLEKNFSSAKVREMLNSMICELLNENHHLDPTQPQIGFPQTDYTQFDSAMFKNKKCGNEA